jgi:uncharacterized membrane protein
MNPTNSAVLTAGVTITGRWAQGKGPTFKLGIGAFVYLILLSLIWDANEQLASQISLLVLITSLFLYAPGIVKKLGYS